MYIPDSGSWFYYGYESGYGSGTVINYGSSYGSDFLARYGSGSTTQIVATVKGDGGGGGEH